ncbi:hypothetical protein [Nonomuraea typhae]|uniref:hypothetical protein n=1 Tax=Nonomuraea typhae TaxID=2603600 RepID=UPI0012F83DE3|nr:hypothetical protein [Nonomuraea typhae]
MTDALFDIDTPPRPPAPERESATVRRTRRQAEQLARGIHPLAGRGLHEQAAPADDRDEVGRRCGNCRWRRTLNYRSGSYPKCVHPGTRSAEDYEVLGPPRAAHSEASDCRAWWPACRDHEPGDPRLPDAMRWVPDPAVMR